MKIIVNIQGPLARLPSYLPTLMAQAVDAARAAPGPFDMEGLRRDPHDKVVHMVRVRRRAGTETLNVKVSR